MYSTVFCSLHCFQIVDNHVIKYNPPEHVLPLRRREKVVPKRLIGKYGALVVGAESADPQEVCVRLYNCWYKYLTGGPFNYILVIICFQFTKNYCGLFRDSGLPPKRKLARFLISPQAVLPAGTPLTAMHYKAGDYVDATGLT